MVSYLELVLAGLGGRRRVQQINGENLRKLFISKTVQQSPLTSQYPYHAMQTMHSPSQRRISTFPTWSDDFGLARTTGSTRVPVCWCQKRMRVRPLTILTDCLER